MCPSMMCADFSNLEQEVKNLDNSGIDIFHIDIMDGHFVPNFGMGLQDLELIRSVTDKPIDVHLMIENPSKYIQLFINLEVDIIYVHPEADQQVTRTLEQIRNQGKKAGIAVNPGTSVSTIQELLPIVDYVLVMTVNPGFSGQKYLEYVDPKIDQLVSEQAKFDFEIMVDGAISPEKIDKLSLRGVEGFVLGTSSLFGKEESYKEILRNLN